MINLSKKDIIGNKDIHLKTNNNSRILRLENQKYNYLKHNLGYNYKSNKLNIMNNKENKNVRDDRIRSMNEIINKLIKVRNKLKEINTEKEKTKSVFKLKKPSKSADKLKILSKSKTKNKYLLYINDYYKNKMLIKKNKTGNFEILDNINKEENNIHYKTIDNTNDLNAKNEQYNSLDKSNYIKSYKTKNKNKNKHTRERILSLDSIEQVKRNKIGEKKNLFLDSYNKKIMNKKKVIDYHIKYIEKIKDEKLMDLINRYKRSLYKNKKEEMSHFKSLVFPVDLINYLIQMKRELIIDKYRNEYLCTIEKYKMNNILLEIKHKNLLVNKNQENISKENSLKNLENNNKQLKNKKMNCNNFNSVN